jgi:hypothetical protein
MIFKKMIYVCICIRKIAEYKVNDIQENDICMYMYMKNLAEYETYRNCENFLY